MIIYLKGEAVPQWLAEGPGVTFGCDVVITSRDDGYLVRPRKPLAADECVMKGTEVPHFPKPVILWTEPDGEPPAAQEGK